MRNYFMHVLLSDLGVFFVNVGTAPNYTHGNEKALCKGPFSYKTVEV